MFGLVSNKNICQTSAIGTVASTMTTKTELWLESEGTLSPSQRQFGSSLRAPPFIPLHKTLLSVLGFYKSKTRSASQSANHFQVDDSGASQNLNVHNPMIAQSKQKV